MTAGLLWLLAGQGLAFTLVGDQSLKTSTTLAGAGSESLAPVGGDGSRTNPLVYSWAASGVSAGLDLQGFKLWADAPATNVSITLDLNGGNVTGSGPYAIDNYAYAFYGLDSGSVVLTNVGSLAAGAIRTATEAIDGATSRAGDLAIGSTTAPAGNIRVDAIDTRAIGGTRGDAGAVSICSSGSVVIGTGSGLAGDILASGAGALGSDGGPVTIQARGSFSAGSIRTTAGSSFAFPARVTLDGGAAGGMCVIGTIDTRFTGQHQSSRDAAPVAISNFATVYITNAILASMDGTHDWDYPYPTGGNATITNITGNIVLDSSNSCNCADNDARDGYLSLSTTGGEITFGHYKFPGRHVLDLYQFKYVRLDARGGRTWIFDSITNFVAGESRLRVARDGDEVRYKVVPNGVNYALYTGTNGGVYQVYSEQGGFGLLKPMQAAGTMVLLK